MHTIYTEEIKYNKEKGIRFIFDYDENRAVRVLSQ